ncbi:beta-1,3-galactosyltransferase 2-like [Protopterus annectens]|uniref:beta-1,3-galactosyltransferase 2-like n=1 Tax=Protopterus annectens TaxID=7888 RepID=UPI001CFC05CD|nr:beta-1,3-galactosyltransferase 2-like [Protopterus annectens]
MLKARNLYRFLFKALLMCIVFMLFWNILRSGWSLCGFPYHRNMGITKYPLDFVYPYNYSFTLNEPEKCKLKGPFLVLLILSHVGEFANRTAIRQTWGNERLVPNVSVVRLFLLGMPTHFKEECQHKLDEESMLFHDIIQQDFMDTYLNLSIKMMMGLQWVSTFCPNAAYIMKIDSDMFLNTEYLVKFLNPGMPRRTDYFTGYIVAGTKPVRSKCSRHYLPKKLYAPDYFPPYCGGPGYLFSGDMAEKIYNVAHVIIPFPVEDAFIGVCLEKLQVTITVSPQSLFNGHKIEYEKCRYAKLITVHHYEPEELLKVWPDFMTAQNTCLSNDIF